MSDLFGNHIVVFPTRWLILRDIRLFGSLLLFGVSLLDMFACVVV